MFIQNHKTSSTIILLACLLFGINCQKPITKPESVTTLNVYAKYGNERVSKVINLRNGGTAIIGSVLNIGFIYVLDAKGNELWYKKEEGFGISYFTDVIENEDLEYIVAGQTSDIVTEFGSPFILKFDQNGDLTWKTQIESFGPFLFLPSKLILEGNGTVSLLGSDMWKIRILYFNKEGEMTNNIEINNLNPNPIPNTYSWWTEAKDYCIAPNGNYIIMAIGNQNGEYKEVNGVIKYYFKLAIMEVDRVTGKKIKQTWIDDFPLTTKEFYSQLFVKIIPHSNSFYVLSEIETGTGSIASRFFKYDLNLDLLSDQIISPSSSFKPTQFSTSPGGKFTICGNSDPYSTRSQAIVTLINESGNSEWVSIWGGNQSKQVALNAKQLSNGYQILGTTTEGQSDLTSFISYKLDTKGNLLVK
jgi:hypothetical protein